MMKCAEAVKPYSHWTGTDRQRGHRAEQVVSTTEETMITLVHQLERENWSTRAIQVYYLYIIVQESTTVSNSGLCTWVHNTIGCYCTLHNVLEAKSRLSIVLRTKGCTEREKQ